jgi:hypothetical protein
MADDRLYAHVRSRLQAIVEGTARQVHDAMEKPNPYSVREVENALDELIRESRRGVRLEEVLSFPNGSRIGLRIWTRIFPPLQPRHSFCLPRLKALRHSRL